MTHISRFLPPTGRNVMTSCRYDAVIIWQMMALNAQLGAHTRLLAFLDAPLFMHLKCEPICCRFECLNLELLPSSQRAL